MGDRKVTFLMPYVDALCTLLDRLIRDRMAEPGHPTDLLGDVIPQLRAVLAQAGHRDAHSEDSAEAQIHPEVDPAAALAVVSAARLAQEHLTAIERAAATIARDSGITVRRLADAAGITERAAHDRYRRPDPLQ